MVNIISDETFENEVLKSKIPVVVDFWATWCGPCKMLAPIVEKLSDEYADKIKFCKIDVDENPNTARNYHVMSIPNLIYVKNGEVVDNTVGALREPDLRSKINALLA